MAKSWFQVSNKSDSPTAEIYLYDEIGLWGITAKDFAASLKELPKAKPITLRINSPGGSVIDGFAVYNLLKERGAVSVKIDGLAASMASVVALAGDSVEIAENAMMMIHDPSIDTCGTSEELRATADILDKMKPGLVSAYVGKTGKSEQEVSAAMAKVTWFTAKEAVAFGLADSVGAPIQAAAKFDLRRFRNVPEAFAKAEGTPPPAPTTPNTPKESTMDNLMKALVEAKFIPSAKLEDKEAALAFEAAMKNHSDAITAKDAEITKLRAELDAAHKAEAEAFVAEAVKAGKIKDDEALKAVWVKAYLSDKETAKAQVQSVAEAKRTEGGPRRMGDPVPGNSGSPEAKSREELLKEYSAITDNRARVAFYAKHKEQLLG